MRGFECYLSASRHVKRKLMQENFSKLCAKRLLDDLVFNKDDIRRLIDLFINYGGLMTYVRDRKKNKRDGYERFIQKFAIIISSVLV